MLEGDVKLDEGTSVEVHLVSSQPPPPTIWEKLAQLSGRLADLPPDAARNLDHYLYGLPKSERGEVFADTSYFVALLGPDVEERRRALEAMVGRRDNLVTAAWVLVELGNFLSPSRLRRG